MCPPAHIQTDFFTERKIRCVVVHDHLLLRQGLRRLLEDEPDIEVVAEAGNISEALKKVAEHRPEIVIADEHLSQLPADQTEWLILQDSPHSKVVFLTGHTTGMQRSGEVSCAPRHTSAEELVEMVRRIEGRASLEAADNGEENGAVAVKPRRVLTAREREVMKLLAEGRTVRSAADALGLSVKTVDAHKFNLMRKLGLHNKAELVMWAIQKKLVRVPAN